ncbi:hypothetical protein QFC19_000104 [Naganishia cerealis]|uniref:Uncharacterized protein n=1 Tax=Naganishia cerealis TaxID=610337 RepID=A0ACC2WRW3_9TREE|nr:hypothetical protein QFC19_000104 [Naganishia cerealis]
MDRPTRRIRFYKPEVDDANPPPQEPSTSIPLARTIQRRWINGISSQISSDTQATSQRPSTETVTPVSRGTPETLRTLELNWRERRRAKLEDITLQRIMGMEERVNAPREFTGLASERSSKSAANALSVPAPFPKRTQPMQHGEPTSRPEKMIRKLKTEAITLSPFVNVASDVHQQRRVHRIPMNDHAVSVTANSTTCQTRTNRARKIVKLVRDARLSVQTDDERASTVQASNPLINTQDGGLTKAQRMPSGSTVVPTPKAESLCLPASSLPSIRKPSAIGEGVLGTPRRVSFLRDASTQQKDAVSRSSSRKSPKSGSARFSVSMTGKGDVLNPITVSPLPAGEYPLSATATLIVYPYEQDWSLNLSCQEEALAGSSRGNSRRPVMSALTGSERIDLLDGGKAMRIKSTSKSHATSKPSRYLRLEEQDSWAEADRRRWALSQLLVDRLRSRTRRVRTIFRFRGSKWNVSDFGALYPAKTTAELPQGTIHVMCNDPPDIVFYTHIIRAPTANGRGKQANYDLSCDTSALISATTDLSRICRSRILFSPTRGIFKVSIRCGSHVPSNNRLEERGKKPFHRSASRRSQTDGSFRSRRILQLPPSTTVSGASDASELIERLYREQKSLVLRANTDKPHRDEAWQMYELQSLGRFLKVKDTWNQRPLDPDTRE